MTTGDTAELQRLLEEQRRRIEEVERRFESLAKVVIPIGVALLNSSNFQELLEIILLRAMDLCHADGGTLYLCDDQKHLRFAILRNRSLGVALGGTSGAAIPFDPLPLVDAKTGTPNHRNVATYAAVTGRTVNIRDAYDTSAGFEFSGTKAFDSQSGYRSMSFLTVPLANNGGRVIGVLQLINATDPESRNVVAFEPGVEPVVESLSTLAAAALEVCLREEGLRREIRELHVRIDQGKREREVAAIADSDYFQDLQRKVRQMRERS